MSDDIARYNKERWEDLAAHSVPFSRPMLELTAESADPDAETGSWDHFCSIAPPYLDLWARLDGNGGPR